MKFFIDMCILMTTIIKKVNNIRYASIRSMDISNGKGVGIALFVQGCHFHCPNCFNPETWDFNGGKEWTQGTEDKLIELADRPYIKRLSILGGEPLADENLDGILHLVDRFRLSLSNKFIWLYTGYTWDQIMNPVTTDDLNSKRDELINKRIEIVKQCDVLVDGKYVESQRDITYPWAGSTNQRVIDVKETLKQNKIILYQ